MNGTNCNSFTSVQNTERSRFNPDRVRVNLESSSNDYHVTHKGLPQ